MPAAVRDVLTEWMRFEDRYGPYELEERLDDVLHGEIHERLAAVLGAPPGDTVVCTGAADAFAAVLSRLPLGPRDRVWTTPYESAAHLSALFALRARTRCRLEVVPLRPDGDLDLEWMAAHAGDDLALVSVTQVPAGCGIVNPVEEAGRILAPYRCLYAVDASYAVGQLPVDVARIGCQLLIGDGWRFLRGPQSVGFAYVAPQLRQALVPYGGLPVVPPHGAVVAAFNAALARHTPVAAPAPSDNGSRLRAAVENTSGTGLIAPGRVQSGIVTFRHEELPAALVRRRLADRGVVVWKTVAEETPLYLPGRGVVTAVRASVRPDDPAEDIELFADALQDAVAEGLPRSARVPRPRSAVPVPHPAVRAARGPDAAPPSGRRRHLTLVSGGPPHADRLQPGA
ncbi:aminotransferase class V-fold PLP-dependent enzyme [Streptomyces sp. NPDC048192]|uniref:aminotransferase class V-fold PLP-dependent enzyme n=1 Tax=Streptomyces sp. NPDC048192 TaxID=3365510 RepID=UPI003723B01C